MYTMSLGQGEGASAAMVADHPNVQMVQTIPVTMMNLVRQNLMGRKILRIEMALFEDSDFFEGKVFVVGILLN
jgi:hypothetical protein